MEFECCGLFIAQNSIFTGFLILLSRAFRVQTPCSFWKSSRIFTDIAKMGSGVVTKAEQTSWQNDSMRWNSNAVDTAGIFQFWFLLTHVTFLDGYVTFKVACVIWLTQVPDPHVPYWNAKKVHSAFTIGQILFSPGKCMTEPETEINLVHTTVHSALQCRYNLTSFLIYLQQTKIRS